MKKRGLALLLIPLLLCGCNASVDKTIDVERLFGDISAFKLTGPDDKYETYSGFTFTWEKAVNAETYSIEISETENFFNDKTGVNVYVKENNISQNSYELNYVLPKKDITYYWRVTAYNKDSSKVSDVRTFKYLSTKVESIPIDIEDAQDWAVHKDGSKATVTIDRNDFFDNGGKNSLVVSFKKEDTSQGPGHEKSDGWIVITKTADMELYGTDSFYMNFYYSGHDSSILIRVLDLDGEYWHQAVKVSNNAKQTVILKYSDFTLRTATGSPIINREFNWQRIHYFEIVFERTFGDGVCMVSDIKAVNQSDYSDMYLTKLDFRRDDIDEWTYENYKFSKSVSIDGSEFQIGFSGTETAELKKFPGYGYQNVNVYKFFSEGDALKLKVKYTGSIASDATFNFRVLEEDRDRWQVQIPFNKLTKNEFTEFLIPLNALQRMQYMNGDGARQFYFVQKINFGLTNNYATGTISLKDVELVRLDEVLESRIKVVNDKGCIEDFNNYDTYLEAYYLWNQSNVNKEESIKLDDVHKAGGVRNTYCANFNYKCDMEAAQYYVKLDSKAALNKNAFKIWLNDATPRDPRAEYSYLDPAKVAAEMTIQLQLDTGEIYRYTIPCVEKEWHSYTIPFKKFNLVNGSSIIGEPSPLISQKVNLLGFAFQYFYFDQNGNKLPTYANFNPVYIDEIYMVDSNAAETVITPLDSTINIDPDNVNYVTIDTFDNYRDTSEAQDYWIFPNNSAELSDVVSTIGGTKSLKANYTNKVTVSRDTSFAQDVTAKGMSFDFKADGVSKISIYFNFRSGDKVYKMVYQYGSTNNPILPSDYASSTAWYHVEIGFNFFKNVTDGTSKTITNKTAKNIELISFDFSKDGEDATSIYIDNVRFRTDLTYTSRSFAPIPVI